MHDVVTQPNGKVLTATETIVLGDAIAGSVSRWYLWVEESDADTFDWSSLESGRSRECPRRFRRCQSLNTFASESAVSRR